MDGWVGERMKERKYVVEVGGSGLVERSGGLMSEKWWREEELR